MRLLRHPVSLMYAFGMFFVGFGLAVVFATEIEPWRGLVSWGASVLGVLLLLTDSILRQLEVVRSGRPGPDGRR
jgi:hypothetical protein